MRVSKAQRNIDQKATAEEILHVLEERSTIPMQMARKEIMDKKAEDVVEKAPVQEALEYLAEGWLKHDRLCALGPAIMSLACEAVGGDSKITAPISAAIILIGSGLEIYDDIIDESETKDSRRTVFGKFGTSMALITGSMLLVKGFALLNKKLPESAWKRLGPISEILERALFELANAESLALKMKGRMDVPPEKYMRILGMRSSIVEAQACIGAIIGGGNRKEVEALGRYGRLLGTLSVVRNEFVDLFNPKELCHRFTCECLPLPILYSLQNPKTRARIVSTLEKEKWTKGEMDSLVNAVLQTEPIQLLRTELQEMVDEANLAISSLEPQTIEILRALVLATLVNI